MKVKKYTYLQILFLIAVFILAGINCENEKLPEKTAQSFNEFNEAEIFVDTMPLKIEPKDTSYEIKDMGFSVLATSLEQQPNAELIIVEIEPARLYPDIIGVSPKSPAGHSSSGIIQREHTSVVLGSGYVKSFHPLSPAGLLILDTLIINPIAARDKVLDGIISVRNGQLHIERVNEFSPTGVSGAFQVGPLLVENGEIKIHPSEPKKIRAASRSFLGLRADGTTIAGISNGPISLYYLASYLAASLDSEGMECISAINLAGGGSETLVFRTPDSVIHYGRSYARQSALIGFTPK